MRMSTKGDLILLQQNVSGALQLRMDCFSLTQYICFLQQVQSMSKETPSFSSIFLRLAGL